MLEVLPAVASTIRRKLLPWFSRHRRDLPWRKDRDPYHIWVSEVMLQQTQVKTVISYFERFITAFPTLAALAAASEHEVLRAWEGLGYYRRARNLHQAARIVVRERAGELPNDPAFLEALPGMGRYTRNAILSQAFDRRLPIIEANSQRVLARIFGQPDDPRRNPLRKWLWQAAERLLPRKRAGDFNQALMELGALVCTPAAPRCSQCPIAKVCIGHRQGIEERIPPPRRSDFESQDHVAVVVRRGPRVLLAQRPAEQRYAGLWEFPQTCLRGGESHDDAAVRWLREGAGLVIEPGPEILTLRHAITRFKITQVCLQARWIGGCFRSTFYEQGRWIKPDDLQTFPISAPQRRLATVLTAPFQQRRLF
jgi:A/G-specific adenine glycosylase